MRAGVPTLLSATATLNDLGRGWWALSWGRDVPTTWSGCGRCVGSCRVFLISRFSSHGSAEANGERGTSSLHFSLRCAHWRTPPGFDPRSCGYRGLAPPAIDGRTPLGFSFVCGVAVFISHPFTSSASHPYPLSTHRSAKHNREQGTRNRERLLTSHRAVRIGEPLQGSILARAVTGGWHPRLFMENPAGVRLRLWCCILGSLIGGAAGG